MKLCSANQIDDSNWALSVNIGNDQPQEARKPVALHYIVDNSKSMGGMTKQVQDIFSEMVDTVATAPCSMTVFNHDAQILSSDITTGQQMRDLALPCQGSTNIPAGVEKALRIIYGQEMKRKQRAKNNKDADSRTHHVMILLSDGEHNFGSTPYRAFPGMSDMLPNDTHLSVVVVGYSRHSNTSMGMLLKKSIETVSFETDSVQTIYFAQSRSVLQSALASLEKGLNRALKGSFHEIEVKDKTLIDNFQTGTETKLRVHVAPGVTKFFLLHCAKEPPDSLIIDGEEVRVTINEEEDLSIFCLSRLIQNLIDKTKVQIVADKEGAKVARECAPKLTALIKALETRYSTKKDFHLVGISPSERIHQYRVIRDVCQEARALRNQVLDIANFSAEGSEKTARFLNGRQMKYANKALRRAAKANDGITDPTAERKALWKDLKSAEFRARLRSAMHMDVLNNLASLSHDQFNSELLPFVRKANNSHVIILEEILQQLMRVTQYDATIVRDFSSSASEFVTSGKLSEYLNAVFHGDRRSFVSLSSPWEHLAEWDEFEAQDFESTWEMLMYAGTVGYPISLERSAASQMNPFLLTVKGVRASLTDTASICCANRAEVPVYGPEGGKPIEDILAMIDPSMPRSSMMICGGKLVGEKYTSAVVARDLHMYSGFNMRVALHSNSLFALFAEPDKANETDIIANLRRTYMGRAYMCRSCGFGPVDHFACSDLFSHHGERRSKGVVVNNACPQCGWFSSSLGDWLEWDGNVCPEFIKSEMDSSPDPKGSESEFLSSAQIDIALRILYSFRKMSSSTAMDEYSRLVKKMARDEFPDFSAKAGIDGMSQILMAALASSNVSESDIADALNSESCLLSIIQEECARKARQRFRAKSGGDKERARKIAIAFLTEMLGVDSTSAPNTQPQMQPEPLIENVRQDCADWYEIESKLALDEIMNVKDVATQWSRAWSFARGFHEIATSREGGWEKIEKDMETGLSSYKDVIDRLKMVKMKSPRQLLGMKDGEITSLYLGIGVGGILTGVLDKTYQPYLRYQPEAILNEAAREMRMVVYLERVKEKMAEWKLTGEKAVYYEARAADIAQFHGMVNMKSHVHGFDRPTFWGLWAAAKNSKNAEKISLFLSTACPEFRYKHHDEVNNLLFL